MRSLHIDTARTWRGGQNQVLLTVNGLAEAGHDAMLLAHEDGELRRRAGDGLRFLGFSPRSEFDVQAGWRLAGVLADRRPDVVHAHDPMAVSLAAMALQMRGSSVPRPLVVASRRVDFHLKQHAFSRWKYRHVDVFVAASATIADILRQDGVEADRIAVVHDGVNVSYIDRQPVADVRAAFWLPHGAPVIGNVAALAHHKGQRHLIDAMALLVGRQPDARLIIVGEGELRGALEEQVKVLGLDRHVTLAGFREDVLSLMKSLDLFVMSSVTEGFGSAILEAMTCGRAVVGTRAGGIPEVVDDGVTGLLVAARQPEALAEAMGRLLTDADRRASMGRAGRARVLSAFSVDALVGGIIAVYERYRRSAPAPRPG
jgi:glycosyltransferase involved in cell wall biosynthesis